MFSPLHHPTSPQAPCACVWLLSRFFSCLWPCVTPWIIAHLAPLSMGFFRKKYWRGLPCSPPGDLPDPGIQSVGKIRWPEVLQSQRKLQEMITEDLPHSRGGRHPGQPQWLSALWVGSFRLCAWQPGLIPVSRLPWILPFHLACSSIPINLRASCFPSNKLFLSEIILLQPGTLANMISH